MRKAKVLLMMLLLGAIVLSMISCAGTETSKSEDEVSQDTTIETESEEPEYLLIFNTNGGQSIPSQKIKYGDTFTLPIPEREGYEFEGWYMGPAVFDDGIWEYTVNVTIDAKWSEIP